MKSAASLTASLLARKGDATPTDGLQPASLDSDIAPDQQGQTGNAPRAAQDAAQRAFSKRPVGAGKRIAMTVRLDHEQHLRLRVFSAHQRLSSQEILAVALDRYIDENAPSTLDTACLSLKT